MANVFDYLKWRDDIPLETLNEVDVLIFNRLVYFPWEKIVNSNESITMSNAYQKCLTIDNLNPSMKILSPYFKSALSHGNPFTYIGIEGFKF